MCVAGEKVLMFFFPPKNSEMRLGRWCNLCHPFEIIYLLKKADLSMWALKSRGMSVVCTWGLRGIFFLTLVLFVLFSHGAVCFCVSPLSYVCTVQ
jgi:hypothetical protein